MGKAFRNGHYLKRVIIGKRTIKEGEAAVIWSRRGKCREIVGPSLQRLFYSTINFLDRYTANPDQYLIVHLKNGEVEHVQGPTAIYKNPVKHEQIKVCNGISLKGHNDNIVVTKPDKLGNMVRTVVNGPALYIPAVGEKVLSFQWTSTKDCTSIEEVQIIKTTAQQVSLKLGFKTRDNHNTEIHLNLSYQIEDVSKALNVNDPFKHLLEALKSDLHILGIMVDAEKLFKDKEDTTTFMEIQDFKFDHLQETATSIGIKIHEILNQGISMPADMKKELELKTRSEMEYRHKLRQTEQQNNIAEIQLKADSEREHKQHNFNALQQTHALELKEQERQAEVNGGKAKNAALVDFLQTIQSLGVDLNEYLTKLPSSERPGLKETRKVIQLNFNDNDDESSACKN
eukprot:m.89159 g.89159  ORF g.89159 m.89159 type:complete len:400 (+) comp13207_c0_seq2:181-1380(+)